MRTSCFHWFFNEVQVALKSILLNAPTRSPLFIYMICDSDAYDALDRVYAESGLEGTPWETQITIMRYNVQNLIDVWWKQVSSVGLLPPHVKQVNLTLEHTFVYLHMKYCHPL